MTCTSVSPTYSKMATDTYTLGCLIDGDKFVFKVEVPIDGLIDKLKDNIKEKRSRYLEKFDAADLTLWKVCYV